MLFFLRILAFASLYFIQSQSAYGAVAEPEIRYSALAISRTAMTHFYNAYGRAVSEDTLFMARQVAKRSTPGGFPDVQVVAEVKRGCIGIAEGIPEIAEGSALPGIETNREGFVAGWSSVPYYSDFPAATEEELSTRLEQTRAKAGALAVTFCEQRARSQCHQKEVFCSWDVTQNSSEDIAEWIAAQGGEWSPLIVDMKLTFSRAATIYLEREFGLNSTQASCASSRYYGTLLRLATVCRIGIDQLDSMLGKIANIAYGSNRWPWR